MNPSYFPQPDILQELAGKNRVVIEASAGTGKTFTLEHLFVDLILSRGVGVDEILVVTYTEKATGELKLRLRKKIEQLASHEGGTKPSGPQSAWEIDAQARERLRAAVAAFDTASISTIHSFCQRVLSEHAFASGRLFEEQLLRGSEALARTFRQVLRETLATDTKKQLLVATYLGQGRPLEHVETLLVQALQHRGTLALRFDEKAVEDFASAFPVSETLEQDLRAEMEVKGRIHARSRERVLRQTVAFARAVEAYRREGNVFELVARIEDSSGTDCLAKLRGELADLYLAFPEPTVGHRVGRALDGLGHSPSLDAALVAHFLPLVRVRLEQSKRELGLCDFDDMLLLVREALRGPGREGLIQSLRSRYRVALIDEFQDTDEVQWEIFRTLFVDGTPSHGVFLIGDPKQAIYGFRGGDVATYLEARDYLLRHGGHAVRLGHNFRSTADVIEGYNRILKQTSPLPFFRGGITYDVPVEAGQNHIRIQGSESAENAAAMVFLDVPANLGDAKARRSALHEAIAKEIVHLLRRVPPPLTLVDTRAPHRPPRTLRAQDIFILTGTAREGAAVAEALRAEGIPYSLFKEAGLFRSDEAQAVATLLDALADPASRSKRRKAYLTPFFAIPLEAIVEADEQPAHQPLPRLFQRLCQLADQPDKAPLVSAALDETGLAKRLLFEGDSRSLTNYTHLFELLLEETRNGARTMDDLRRAMRAFLSGKRRPVAQDEDEKRLDTDEDAVQILTMHKSKGLEAEVVFLAGGFGRKPGQDVIYHEDGARVRVVGFPFDGEKDKALEERDAEDRRVIYVALTRPKSRLYLPRFGKPEKGKRLDISGVYGCLQERLEAMAEEGGLLEPPIFDQSLVKAARPSWHSRSTPSTEEVQGDAMAVEAAPASIPGDPQVCSGEASPPTFLPTENSSDALYESIRSRCSGVLVSSYSQLKRRNTTAGGLALEPDRHLEIRGTDDVLPLERTSDDLPGGTATGLFLHAVLEHIPFDEVNQASDADSLLTSPTIRPIFERSAALFGVSTECLPRAAELVFGALNHPLRLGVGAQTTVRLGQASRILRELEFTYPIPEKHHPSLGDPSPMHLEKGFFSIDRGLLRGFIDLVFEFEGKVYVLDWKSDRLANFHRQHIRAHVTEHYALQARIYLLALVRFLRIREETAYERRLGGAVYVFLRAMGSLIEPDYGVYSLRPSWGELCQWERELGTHPAFPSPSQRLGDQL